MEECLINTGVTACVRGLINYIKLHPMMNPLNMLNFALSNEQIQMLSEQVIAKLSTKLVEVEQELANLINQ